MLLQQAQNEYSRLVDRCLLNIRPQGPGQPSTASSSPVIDLVNLLLEQAITAGASDIHLEPAADGLRVRLRLDGSLTELDKPLPPELTTLIISRLKVMSRLDTTDKRRPLDGRFTYPFHGREIDVRVSTLPLLDGEKLVLRLLNTTNQLLSIDQLNFSAPNEALFRRWCRRPNGLILNVGPVGSGKTTTLYAALSLLNSPERNIVTIEDPVEYYLSGISQVQVNPAVDLTFATGLRAILRQDPDILMVGEIRDNETAEIAVRAGLTGRLIFSTLHASDACGAVSRLLDMQVRPYLLADTLLGVIAQRLVRRLCPECKARYPVAPGSPEAELLGELFTPGLTLYRPVGCPACHGTGYRGRMAIHELLTVTPQLHAAILREPDAQQLRTLARQNGMTTLLQDGLTKALAGETALEEVSRVV